MSGRTWALMLLILALNWGGFVVTLTYGLRREARRAVSPDRGGAGNARQGPGV